MIFMVAFRQTGPDQLEIDWSDRQTTRLTLDQIQQSCPCASCKQTRQETIKNVAQDKPLSARRVRSVGRYAIRVEFTFGCSQGIYSYDQLRSLHLAPSSPF